MIRLENVLKTSLQDVLKMYWRRFCIRSLRHFENMTSWQDVLKMSWRRFSKTSWRSFENLLKASWQGIFKTSWKRLEDVWPKQIYCSWPRRLEDVFWRCIIKANIFVLIKTSWRHLEDVSWRWKTFSRCLENVFIKTDVRWALSKLIFTHSASCWSHSHGVVET